MTKLRWWTKLLIFVAVLGGGSFTFLRGSTSRDVDDVLSSEPATAEKAIAALRNAGPEGLAAVLRNYDQSHDERLIPVIDAVAAQRDAVWSRLYWYTDLDRAKAAAQSQNKPILYLRLMGKLTDEYSCANSRFFRTVLYANQDVSKALREQYILVWGSERPVPVVTIDYGDGRILKRTLTGNSIHYILSPQGKVVDALPGLYAPKTFNRILAAARIAALPQSSGRSTIESDYRTVTFNSLGRDWIADRARIGATAVVEVAAGPIGPNPAAMKAMRRAVSKTVVEMPLLARISPDNIPALDRSIDKTDASFWRKIADLHLAEARLDSSSIDLLKSKNPAAYERGDSLQRTVAQFENSIALDTVHNNYEYRRRIFGWLKDSNGEIGLEDLNRRVYSELFLTPRTDPWLGLTPDATYTALPANGAFASIKYTSPQKEGL